MAAASTYNLQYTYNTGVNQIAQQLIDQMCLEINRTDNSRVFLTESSRIISDCVAGYTHFDLLYRICNAIKTLFGCSDWQKARDALCVSLLGKNFAVLTYPQAKTIAHRLIEMLIEENAHPSSDYNHGLQRLHAEFFTSLSNVPFELGQLSFSSLDVYRSAASTVYRA